MNPEDRTIRDLEAPQALPLQADEVELRIKLDQVEKLRRLSRTATCTSCGAEMASDGRSTTGLCLKCNRGSKVIEVQPDGTYKLIARVLRRPNKRARKIARRQK